MAERTQVSSLQEAANLLRAHHESFLKQQEIHHKKQDAEQLHSREIREQLYKIKDILRTIVANQNKGANKNMMQDAVVDDNSGRSFQNQGVRLNFPHFDGYNVSQWIFKAN